MKLDEFWNLVDLDPRDFVDMEKFLDMAELNVYEKLLKIDFRRAFMFRLGVEHRSELIKSLV